VAHWKDSICLITSTDPGNRGFGTGFVFHRDSTGRSFLLTCLHVVETLEKPRRGSQGEPPGLLADGLVAEVWVRGDAVLDLAVLAVDGLRASPLRLGDPIERGREVETAGYTEYEPAQQTVVSRPLVGRVQDNNPVKSLRRPGRVGARSLDIEIDAELFRELRDGYSGSPVIDPGAGEVVGIMNLKWSGVKGHAICAGSCRLLFEKANARQIPDYGRRSEMPRPTGSAGALEGALAWMASTLDHADPIERIALRLKEGPTQAKPGLWFYAVQAGLSDCPRALAEHLAVQFGGLSSRAPWPGDLIVDLGRPVPFGGAGLWKALADFISPEGSAEDPADESERVVHWINRGLPAGPRALRVVYCQFPIAGLRPRIPGFIADAIRTFAGLQGLRADVRVLFLFACIAQESGVRALLGRLRPLRLAHIPACETLGPPRPLNLVDLDDWLRYAARPLMGGRRLDGVTLERLRSDLIPLFPDDAARLRYQAVHDPALRILREATLTESTNGDRG
jgi:hypothetical protein